MTKSKKLFKNNLKKFREEADMSQAELAKKIGMNSQSISNLESSRDTFPKQETLDKLSKVLKKPISEFFNEN